MCFFVGPVHFYWGSAKNKFFATIPRVEMVHVGVSCFEGSHEETNHIGETPAF